MKEFFMKRCFVFVVLVFCISTAVFVSGCAKSSGSTQDASGSAGKTSSGFPSRSIEIIVPYAPASGNDINVRTIAPTLEKYLGVSIVVNNEPAGNGLPALTKIGKNIRADGYTWSIANIVATTSQHVLGDFVVDPSTEYVYLGVIVVDPGVIVAAKNGPYKTLDDIVRDAKARPGQISYGGTGEYSLDGLLCTNLEELTGIDINFINYGGSEGITAIMGGHLDLMGSSLAEAVQPYLDGAIEIIGIGGDNRAPECPDVPTFKEQGYEFKIQAAERALMTRVGTNEEILNFMRDAFKKASEDPEYIERCKNIGMRNQYVDPDTTLRDVKNLMDFFNAIK
jgi:tripartite-type tricarboxylate transporter receptor subunit TctC